MRRGKGGRALSVIAMAVRDEHGVEPCVAESSHQVREMSRLTDAGVDQRRRSRAADDQIGVVARPGHRPGIVGGQQNRVHRETITKG